MNTMCGASVRYYYDSKGPAFQQSPNGGELRARYHNEFMKSHKQHLLVSQMVLNFGLQLPVVGIADRMCDLNSTHGHHFSGCSGPS